jgi:hypothetical protein
MQELWQQEAARIGGPIFAEVLIEMRDSQRLVVEKVTALEASNARLMSGFPANDIDGHRRYHESVIEWRELRNKLVREALIKAVQASAVGAFGWVAIALWQSIKLSVKQ